MVLVDGWMNGWVVWMDYTDWMGGWVDGWMDGCVVWIGWVDGWMSGMGG